MRAITPQPGGRARSAPNAERATRAWAKTIAGTSYVSMNRKELHSYLKGHVETLLAAISADTFEPTTGADIGAALVAAHFTQPLSLDRTLSTLSEQLGRGADPQCYKFRGGRIPVALSPPSLPTRFGRSLAILF